MCNFPLIDMGTAIIHLKRGGGETKPQNYKPESHLGQNYFSEEKKKKNSHAKVMLW